MSLVAIRSALEVGLNGVSPPMATAWQRKGFDPATDVPADEPYQRAELLYADPENNENTSSYTDIGFLQITLCYPVESDVTAGGSAEVEGRIDLLRTIFKRKASFSAGGVTVTIHRTLKLLPPYKEGARDCQPVRVPFYAHINA
jgi:hypothetical protein